MLKKYSDNDVAFIWFTDEKIFMLVAHTNPQNDRIHAPATLRKRQVAPERLLIEFPQVTDGVSGSVQVGETQLVFDPGVKISGAYYRNVLLT